MSTRWNKKDEVLCVCSQMLHGLVPDDKTSKNFVLLGHGGQVRVYLIERKAFCVGNERFSRFITQVVLQIHQHELVSIEICRMCSRTMWITSSVKLFPIGTLSICVVRPLPIWLSLPIIIEHELFTHREDCVGWILMELLTIIVGNTLIRGRRLIFCHRPMLLTMLSLTHWF